uniref:Macaca fascicularis brain cDNA, clone: QmoA-12427 n=1 Tax=Macaca fascicularis TaxID=9541 RepID=I7GNC6_MACFA|nr:unnamed protein product [Macaca fascicularis]
MQINVVCCLQGKKMASDIWYKLLNRIIRASFVKPAFNAGLLLNLFVSFHLCHTLKNNCCLHTIFVRAEYK